MKTVVQPTPKKVFIAQIQEVLKSLNYRSPATGYNLKGKFK